MQSWFGLNLVDINGTQFLILLGVWFGFWVICHVLSGLAHKFLQKLASRLANRRKLQNLLPAMRARKSGYVPPDPKEDRPKTYNELSLQVDYIFLEYLCVFLHPLVFTRKSKLALATLTTWAVAKFWVLC